MSGLIDYKLKENGCERPSYASIVGSGPNSTTRCTTLPTPAPCATETLSSSTPLGNIPCTPATSPAPIPSTDISAQRQREIYWTSSSVLRNAARRAFCRGQELHGQSPDAREGQTHTTSTKDRLRLHQHPRQRPAWRATSANTSSTASWTLGRHRGTTTPLRLLRKPFLPGSVFTIEPGIYISRKKVSASASKTSSMS